MGRVKAALFDLIESGEAESFEEATEIMQERLERMADAAKEDGECPCPDCKSQDAA